MDLAKIGETKHLHFSLERPKLIEKIVNDLLKEGWVIVTVKLVEKRGALQQDDGKRYPYADSSLFYILGRPRERPSGLRALAESDARR